MTKPPDAVEVVLELGGRDVVAGRLFMHTRRGTESASFRYDESYLARPQSYDLDPALPRGLGPQQTPVGRIIFNTFSDSAPDRWGRSPMQRGERSRAKSLGVAPRFLPSADFLLGVNDFLRQGAIRFKEPGSEGSPGTIMKKSVQRLTGGGQRTRVVCPAGDCGSCAKRGL